MALFIELLALRVLRPTEFLSAVFRAASMPFASGKLCVLKPGVGIESAANFKGKMPKFKGPFGPYFLGFCEPTGAHTCCG
jgi:hypothetical protein